MKRQILAISKKELSSYFGSPLAVIFLGAFLAATLFIFFSVETFFARGIADVRPLFRWMPALLIFLLAALTMRQWSEEQRAGTQELLLTLPVKPMALALGKFLAVMTLILIALALTLPLPLTVSAIGSLDWGPVFGGYLAALLMAGAYAAIGLFVSSRTDNQIVALIVTVLVGGLFYLVGTRGVTDFVGGNVSEYLWAVGTGSRFESIQRGVIDLRDLSYYLSLTGLFLMLNTVSLDSIRWSRQQTAYRKKVTLTAVLIGLNLLLVNVWLYPLQRLRLDLTAQKEYSLSQTTKDLFGSLQEPLVIRAYISENTHPLLAPLIPPVRDMLREYEIASNGRIAANVVDPLSDPEIELEAGQTYGIRPTPFQIEGRNEASVVNAYFDILIRYGDQTAILNFQDIIQAQPTAAGIDVTLRNLEYDLTSSIKKVLFGFQSIDSVLAAIEEPVRLTLFVTPDTLPESLADLETAVTQAAEEIQSSSDGKFIYQAINPDDPNGEINRQYLQEAYGLQPIPVSLFSADTFYAYMVLESGDEAQLLYPPADLSEGQIRAAIESALKRASSGFLKVVGVWAPTPPPANPQFGGAPPTFFNYNLIQEQLGQEYTTRQVDLSGGQVANDVDMLMVMAPQNLTQRELFAIDQFLMRGGAVVIGFSNYSLSADFSGGLALQPVNAANIADWLANYGVTISEELVMDPQNQPFPLPVVRNVGGFQVQEIQAVDYPFFVDVRPDGMDTSHPIAANLPAATLNWASPVRVDETVNGEREVSVLLRSSPDSWLKGDASIQPNYDLYPELGFPIEGEQGRQPLAVTLQGRFESYYAARPSPFEEAPTPGTDADTLEPPPDPNAPPVGKITSSPESSRLVVIGSAAFVEDNILNLSSRLTQDALLGNLQFMQNVADWSAADLDLLAIRSRGAVTRVLDPMTESEQNTWEISNYAAALVALLAIYFGWRARQQQAEPLPLIPMTEAETVS